MLKQALKENWGVVISTREYGDRTVYRFSKHEPVTLYLPKTLNTK